MMNKQQWDKCVEFHGHACPGLAIGFKACEAVMEKMKIEFSLDEEVVCVTENDACGVDAIQLITGCSIGKGNLLRRNTGKQAFSFFNRNTGVSIRLVLKPIQGEMDREQRQEYLLNTPATQLFEFKQPHFSLPAEARIFATIICEQCGEGAAEHKIRFHEGKKVCSDCFVDYDRGW